MLLQLAAPIRGSDRGIQASKKRPRTARRHQSVLEIPNAGILIFGLILTIRTVSHELELAKMKSDFVSTVSHEFKSPLTSIQQLAEMLQAGRIPSEARFRRIATEGR